MPTPMKFASSLTLKTSLAAASGFTSAFSAASSLVYASGYALAQNNKAVDRQVDTAYVGDSLYALTFLVAGFFRSLLALCAFCVSLFRGLLFFLAARCSTYIPILPQKHPRGHENTQ